MDQGTLIMLIPVLALAIGFVAVLKMPRRAFGHGSTPRLEERVQAVEHEISGLRQELADTQERLDFAERLLARVEEARRLP